MRNALVLLLLSSAVRAAVFTPYEPLRFDPAPAELLQDCGNAKKRAETALAQIASLSAPSRTFDNTPWALDRAMYDLSDHTAADVFLQQVSLSSAVRDASNQCDVMLAQFGVEVYSREDLYKALKEYAAKDETLRGEDARLLEKTLLDFKRSGLELTPEKRAALREIRKKIAGLESAFGRAINESKEYALMTRAQLEGAPEDLIARLPRVGDKYQVGVDYPTYLPFMENARDPEARRLLLSKFDERAATVNVARLSEALALRREAARLLGYPSHAAYVEELYMAKDPKTVEAFLSRMRGRLDPLGREDLAVLAALKRAMEGRASDGAVHVWDWRYYDNLLRKTKYEVDSEKVREYFPTDLVVEQMLSVYQTLLGLKFREVDKPLTWHPDAKLYAVADAAGGDTIGYFYMDLFPRDGKYKHAAAFNIVVGRRLADGTRQPPVSAIVANLDKPTADRPSLLNHDEVETLFHEFGHIMHQTLTKAKYGRFAGSNTARDFVEAPSQMLQNWVWDPVVLQSLSGHYKDRSKKLPKDLLDKMIAAKNADVGLITLRQLLFGHVDMAYHGRRPPSDTTKTYRRLAADVFVPILDGTHPQASFGHLMGGYDAGYYGYLWSKVYAQDMFSVFQKQGVMDPALGRRYRQEILERGSTRDEMESLKAFLGRAPSEDAFFESIGLKR
ncbi:MAG: Zn-dependent oligopeptidase [Elusimicrobia bacterium]|nr:Zn-dependent oligopeptidase [Elusimicrobiota bacterium]